MVAGYSMWSLKTGLLRARSSPLAPALVITLLVALPTGVLMELLAFRPLRTASPLAKMAASIGVLLVAQGAVLLGFGTAGKPAPSDPADRHRRAVRRHGAGEPLHPGRHRHRRRRRAHRAVPVEPVRSGHAGGVGERGRGDAGRPVAQPAVDGEHAPGQPGGRRPRRPGRIGHAAQRHDPAAADHPRTGGGAVRPLHLVLDRVHGRAPHRHGPERARLPVHPQLVPEGPGPRHAGVEGPLRLRRDRDRDVLAGRHPAGTG